VSLARSFLGRRAALWLAPAALVAANLVWLSAFGTGSRVRLRELSRRLEQATRTRAAVEARLAEREKLWIDAAENRARIETLYRDKFATERARFTDQVRELKALAERAGLVPAAIAYPEERLLDYGLVKRSFVFSVNGGYAALRTLLHLLELSDSFLTVEQIAVSEARGELGVRLRLATLFEAVKSDADAAARGGLAAAGDADAGQGTAAVEVLEPGDFEDAAVDAASPAPPPPAGSAGADAEPPGAGEEEEPPARAGVR
jgi:hypothetical protein